MRDRISMEGYSPRTIFPLKKLVRRTEIFGPPDTFSPDQFFGDRFQLYPNDQAPLLPSGSIRSPILRIPVESTHAPKRELHALNINSGYLVTKKQPSSPIMWYLHAANTYSITGNHGMNRKTRTTNTTRGIH